MGLAAGGVPALAAALVLLAVSLGLARRRGVAIVGWAVAAVLAAAVAARLGFVIANRGIYTADPMAVLAIWQGGFSPGWGAAGFLVLSAWFLWRRTELLVPATVAVVLAFIGWNLAQQLARGLNLGPPEDIRLTTLAGDPVSPADWRGRPVVVNLWATWCPPCRREMPMMAEVAAGVTDIDIHFVNQGEGANTVRFYLFGEMIGIVPVMDPESLMRRHFAALGLPTTLFIDAEGTVQAVHMGEISRAQLLAGIERLRAGS